MVAERLTATLWYCQDRIGALISCLLPGALIRCDHKRLNTFYLYFAAMAWRWEDAGVGVEALRLPSRWAVYLWYVRQSNHLLDGMAHREIPEALKVRGEE